MRLGRVVLDLGYVVDVENQDMVDHAKEAIFEDIMNATKYNELGSYIEVVNDKDATEDLIPEFLLPEDESEE